MFDFGVQLTQKCDCSSLVSLDLVHATPHPHTHTLLSDHLQNYLGKMAMFVYYC